MWLRSTLAEIEAQLDSCFAGWNSSLAGPARSLDYNVVSLAAPVGRWDDYKQSRIKNYKLQRWDGDARVDLVAGGLPAPCNPLDCSHLGTAGSLSFRERPGYSEIGVYDDPEYYRAE
jgi:hypothetical protein